MAPTATKRLRAEKQEQYTNEDSWGPELNVGTIDVLDAGWGTSEIVVSGNVTLTANNFITDQSRGFALLLTGAGGFTVTTPSVDKPYLIINNCAADVTIKPGTGTAAVVRAGVASMYYTNAAGTVAGVVDPTLDKIKAPVAAVGMNGQRLTGLATGVSPGDAVNLQQAQDIAGAGSAAAAAASAALAQQWAANPRGVAVSGGLFSSRSYALDAADASVIAMQAASDALAAYDAFDDRYLGAKSADPTLDNDGNALLTGALYWNTASNNLRAYSGSVWVIINAPVFATQAQAEAGILNNVVMTPLTTAQAINARPLVYKNDLRRNLWVNGSFFDSQENGNSSSIFNGYYPADQISHFCNISGNPSSVQRVQTSKSLLNAPNKIEFKCSIVTNPLNSTSIDTITGNIEGSDPDFVAAGFGSAGASQFVIRFELSAPTGLYHWHFQNSAGNRHCAVPFTVTAGQANVAVVREIIVPPDTTGTWLTGAGQIGITCDLVLAAGSARTGGSPSTWSGSTFYAASTQKNILDSNTNVVRLADVGLKLDPDATGVYGVYRVGEVDPVYRSERYLASWGGADLFERIAIGQCESTTQARFYPQFVVPMCKKPTLISTGPFAVTSPAGVPISATIASGTRESTKVGDVTATSTGLTAGNATQLNTNNSLASRLFYSARLS